MQYRCSGKIDRGDEEPCTPLHNSDGWRRDVGAEPINPIVRVRKCIAVHNVHFVVDLAFAPHGIGSRRGLAFVSVEVASPALGAFLAGSIVVFTGAGREIEKVATCCPAPRAS